MSITYTDNRPTHPAGHFEPPVYPNAREEAPFVPVYARTGRSRTKKGGVRTWMILAPIGVLVLGGVTAAMLMSGGEEVAPVPVLEPAATAPVLPATAPLAATSAPVEIAPAEAAPAPAPVVRREAAPVRRAAPAPTARQTAPAPAVREAAPPSPSTLNSAPPTPAPAPTAPAAAEPPPPAIVVQPLN